MREKAKNRGDLVGSLLLITTGIGVMIGSIRLTVGTPVNPQPGFFPFVGSLILISMSLILLVKGWLGHGRRMATFGEVRRPAILVAGMGVYTAALGPMGYLLATIPLAALILRVMGVKSWRVVSLVSVALSAITYLLFAGLLGIELPAGVLKFLG
jgi:putative tricarboxylic transport membrane protein